uniref:Variant surface glycoprotein 1125.4786 n=1 Tax=Trypanosoma brucei TaxID=5691 RepID=A0A1J0RB51_9TRYP|nr:variant surface glycoprotein 1125.4786 [Trypanosoma brucei]
MLTAATNLAEPPNQVKEIAEAIGAIIMSISDAEFSKLIAHDKDWPESEAAKAAKSKPFETMWQIEHPFWKQAAVKINSDKQTFEQWRKAELSKAAKETVKHIAEQAAKAFRNADLSNFHALKTKIENHAKTVLYGGPAKTGEEEEPNPTSRACICGTSGTTEGTEAGKSIKADLLCACAKKSDGVNNMCCAKCDHSSKTWDNAAASAALWTPLLKNCPSHAPTMQLWTTNMDIALSQFLTLISKKQGTTNNKQYILGTLNGAGTGGCDGSSGAGSGICVQYKAVATGDTVKPEIAWLQAAKDAAKAADSIAERNKRVEQLERELRLLKFTIGAQIHHVQSYATTTERSVTNQNQEPNKTENDCKSHINKTEEECKNLGCNHGTESKKCKPKAGTETPAVGTGNGAAGATTEKCKGKLEHECTKTPDCRWENNTPKDCSFLLNKKLTLIAAALMSSLFY